jgi:hypothetical protein
MHGPDPTHGVPGRPGLLWIVWYVLGGGLPARHREWVLHDVSCDRWALRHFLRAFAQISVAAPIVYVVMPGPVWARACAVLLGFLVGMQYSLWFLDGSVERRARRAGYPPEAVKEARAALHAEESAAAEARYVERWRNGH